MCQAWNLVSRRDWSKFMLVEMLFAQLLQTGIFSLLRSCLFWYDRLTMIYALRLMWDGVMRMRRVL